MSSIVFPFPKWYTASLEWAQNLFTTTITSRLPNQTLGFPASGASRFAKWPVCKASMTILVMLIQTAAKGKFCSTSFREKHGILGGWKESGRWVSLSYAFDWCTKNTSLYNIHRCLKGKNTCPMSNTSSHFLKGWPFIYTFLAGTISTPMYAFINLKVKNIISFHLDRQKNILRSWERW